MNDGGEDPGAIDGRECFVPSLLAGLSTKHVLIKNTKQDLDFSVKSKRDMVTRKMIYQEKFNVACNVKKGVNLSDPVDLQW